MNRLCTRHIDTRVLAHARQRLVVVGAADLEALALEDDAIEGHCLCRFVHWTKLYRGKNNQTCWGETPNLRLSHDQSRTSSIRAHCPTSRKAKFLSWLICTARTGFPGAWVRPPRRIWALKKSIIDSYTGEMEWMDKVVDQTDAKWLWDATWLCNASRRNFSRTHEPLWYRTGCCRRTADGPAGSSDCPRLVLGWVWQPGHRESWWAGGLWLESVPQLEGEKGT